MNLLSILAIAAGLLALVVAVDFAIAYFRSSSTGTQRLWDAGRGSATIVVCQLGFIGGGVDTGLQKLADFLNMPGVSDAIKGYLPAPAVGAAVIVFAAIALAARLRTL